MKITTVLTIGGTVGVVYIGYKYMTWDADKPMTKDDYTQLFRTFVYVTAAISVMVYLYDMFMDDSGEITVTGTAVPPAVEAPNLAGGVDSGFSSADTGFGPADTDMVVTDVLQSSDAWANPQVYDLRLE